MRWPQIFIYESIKLLLFAGLWFSIIFGLSSFALWKQERERLLTLQKHLAESQLAQLRAQLQPHFLFNALNTISSLMQVDVDRADRLLAQLADLLRSSLQAGTRQITSLREELGAARALRTHHAGAFRRARHAAPRNRRRHARCRSPRHAAAAAARERLQTWRRAQQQIR